ncbi:MAG: signal peptidase I [archaeon]
MDKKWNEMTSWEKVKKVYNYTFHENQVLSWIANILLAFIIVKFIFFPVMGWALNTELPLVGVISPSMEHEHMNFDSWWIDNGQYYEDIGITKAQFEQFKLHNGFYKGDVIALRGREVQLGDIVVYQNEESNRISPYPIIHRVIFINEDDNSLTVKGDNNPEADRWIVKQEDVKGVVTSFKIPYIGYIKIWFSQLIGG